jgi:hypothetical protein
VRGVIAQMKDRPGVVLVDLPVNDERLSGVAQASLALRRSRLRQEQLDRRGLTDRHSPPGLTDRARWRWVTRQVGRCARSVVRIGAFAAQNALLCEEPDQRLWTRSNRWGWYGRAG